MTAIDDEVRFTTLPDEQTLAATVAALEEHGFGVEVVDDFEAARLSVLERIPHGSQVMTNTSVTLRETGIDAAINDPDGPYVSARNKMMTLDFRTQQQEMKAIAGQADYALGSAQAITADGTVVFASATGSQLAAYAWGAPNVILVAGTQKLVPSLRAAHERVVEHSLKLEDVRAQAAYGQHSYIGKLLEIRQEQPGRIHLVLIRQNVGF
ncbi:LUD domain-containing protein [Streptomyces sp. NPDC059575]|uniref:LUD domain-containing protein n=1 Tax=Streptomyces sp. NPDC059575 TaxID=3346872 RepID=UPI0036C0397D